MQIVLRVRRGCLEGCDGLVVTDGADVMLIKTRQGV